MLALTDDASTTSTAGTNITTAAGDTGRDRAHETTDDETRDIAREAAAREAAARNVDETGTGMSIATDGKTDIETTGTAGTTGTTEDHTANAIHTDGGLEAGMAGATDGSNERHNGHRWTSTKLVYTLSMPG